MTTSFNISSGQTLCWIEREHERLMKKIVQTHHFNSQAMLMLCDYGGNDGATGKISTARLAAAYSDEKYIEAEGAVSQLLNHEFISNYIMKGRLFALSKGTTIDTKTSFCILPDGVFVLLMCKTDYEVLGLDGPKSKHDPSFHVCRIDMKAPGFKPGQRNYDRLFSALETRFSNAQFIMYWQPPEGANSKITLPEGIKGSLQNVTAFESKRQQVLLPDFVDATVEISQLKGKPQADTEISIHGLLDWIGLMALEATQMIQLTSLPQTRIGMDIAQKRCDYSAVVMEGFLSAPQTASLVEAARYVSDVERLLNFCPFSFLSLFPCLLF
eukprot:TRINITY_DN4754_c0_g1_i2.p1 TRINITY_DN4754_c0_g1~~TRINITY_DN4754_c0_g1_i2.p1  ORF type:complete len:327 (-),score=62.73 TRINITY_DN4754_c0_g1_i2:365-1345(-)